MLRGLVARLKPGGLLVFHEIDWDGARSQPPVPTHDRCCEWMVKTIARSARIQMRRQARGLMKSAGLPARACTWNPS